MALYERWASKYRWRTLAWALLDNHHHFLVQLINGDLSTGLQVLHSGFSRRMNEKYGETRRGHLVRHCFYAGALETADSILAVARYVDLNPVRAGLVRAPEDSNWSSYAATIGLAHPRPFHAPGELLRLLGPSPTDARDTYRTYVLDGLAEPRHGSTSDEGYEFVTDRAMVESST